MRKLQWVVTFMADSLAVPPTKWTEDALLARVTALGNMTATDRVKALCDIAINAEESIDVPVDLKPALNLYTSDGMVRVKLDFMPSTNPITMPFGKLQFNPPKASNKYNVNRDKVTTKYVPTIISTPNPTARVFKAAEYKVPFLTDDDRPGGSKDTETIPVNANVYSRPSEMGPADIKTLRSDWALQLADTTSCRKNDLDKLIADVPAFESRVIGALELLKKVKADPANEKREYVLFY